MNYVFHPAAAPEYEKQIAPRLREEGEPIVVSRIPANCEALHSLVPAQGGRTASPGAQARSGTRLRHGVGPIRACLDSGLMTRVGNLTGNRGLCAVSPCRLSARTQWMT